jgi:hypothetical protein
VDDRVSVASEAVSAVLIIHQKQDVRPGTAWFRRLRCGDGAGGGRKKKVSAAGH